MEAIMDRRNFLRGTSLLAAASSMPLALTLTGCNVDWIGTAQKDIPIIANIVTSLAGVALTASGNGLLAPEVYAAIKLAVAAAQTGLTTLQQVTLDLQKNPTATTVQKIDTIIADIQSNLSSILSAGHIVNSGLVTTISAGIALALSTLSSIELLIPAKVSANSVKKASLTASLKTVIKLPDASTIASMYNTVAVANGYGQHQVAAQ